MTNDFRFDCFEKFFALIDGASEEDRIKLLNEYVYKLMRISLADAVNCVFFFNERTSTDTIEAFAATRMLFKVLHQTNAKVLQNLTFLKSTDAVIDKFKNYFRPASKSTTLSEVCEVLKKMLHTQAKYRLEGLSRTFIRKQIMLCGTGITLKMKSIEELKLFTNVVQGHVKGFPKGILFTAVASAYIKTKGLDDSLITCLTENM